MKTCTGCKLDLSDSEFYGRKSICKICSKRYQADYYKTHKKTKRRNREETNRWKADLAQRKREMVNDFKERTPCQDCGKTYPCWVMEFDHRDRQAKRYPVSDMIWGSWSIDSLLREIEKCDLICANCHRIRTAKQLGWTRSTWADSSGTPIESDLSPPA